MTSPPWFLRSRIETLAIEEKCITRETRLVVARSGDLRVE
jgi:hypothetical protein